MDKSDVQEEQDVRIEEATAVKDAMQHTGVKILMREWEKVRDVKLADLSNEAIADDTLKARQVLFNEVKDWLDLPNRIIKMGEDAVAEDEEPEKETVIKKAVNFIGRRA